MAQRSEDLELVARVVAGDQTALSSLLQQVRAIVRSCLQRAKARNRSLEGQEDDLLQGFEVLLVQDDFKVLRSYRGDAALTTFVYSVAGRFFHRQGRKSSRPASDLSAAAGVADPGQPQDEALLDAAERARVRAALDRLSAEDRTLLLLLVEDEMPAPRVASLLGITPGGVRMRKMRALARLEELLKGP
ncbi:MAG: sigma-70 family RNA polymerase sigma factor [Deltaproteobacteria bacterium]|nr:sigma-70 family RNA polymerase sigma factor [Deltaproteobacteria bacterium]